MTPSLLAEGVAAILTVSGIAVFAGASRRRARTAGGVGLLCALTGGFYLYMAWSPMAVTRVPVALALFV